MELRLAAAPPDLLLVPDVRGIGLLEFYSAAEAVEAGRAAALAQIDGIEALLPRAAAS